MTMHLGSSAAILVMGVSGVGKTTVGQALASRLVRPFVDADDFHSVANVQKMGAGQPLTEADRRPWLEDLARALVRERDAGRAPVVAVSALARAHRAVLQSASPESQWVFLRAPRGVIEARLHARSGHFMPASLLDSQLGALEEPETAVIIDASEPVAAIVDRIVRTIWPTGLPSEAGTTSS